MTNKLLLSLFVCVFLFSCGPKDPDDVNGEELITTLIYTVTNTDTNESLEFVYRDLDGDAGNAPEVTVPILKANTSYTADISLLDESKTPAESIDEEVDEEADEHQFFFTSEILDVMYADTDSAGNPVGLKSTFSTADAGSGSLQIILRHKPAKDAAGVSDNDITNAGGDTDIQVNFDVVVED